MNPEGLLLRIVAELVGARVTSWFRTAEHNAAVGGHANSKHLTGEAIDVGREAHEFQRSVLRMFGREVVEADHFHYQTDGRGLVVSGGVLVGLIATWMAEGRS